MSVAALLLDLQSLGVRVVSPETGRIKLVSDGAAVPAVAYDHAKPFKSALVEAFDRSADLGRCPDCDGPLIAALTFDGFENIECMACDRCHGCRRAAQ